MSVGQLSPASFPPPGRRRGGGRARAALGALPALRTLAPPLRGPLAPSARASPPSPELRCLGAGGAPSGRSRALPPRHRGCCCSPLLHPGERLSRGRAGFAPSPSRAAVARRRCPRRPLRFPRQGPGGTRRRPRGRCPAPWCAAPCARLAAEPRKEPPAGSLARAGQNVQRRKDPEDTLRGGGEKCLCVVWVQS